jgi:hypothetical protein
MGRKKRKMCEGKEEVEDVIKRKKEDATRKGRRRRWIRKERKGNMS